MLDDGYGSIEYLYNIGVAMFDSLSVSKVYSKISFGLLCEGRELVVGRVCEVLQNLTTGDGGWWDYKPFRVRTMVDTNSGTDAHLAQYHEVFVRHKRELLNSRVPAT